MIKNLDNFILDKNSTIRSAMLKISKNQRGIIFITSGVNKKKVIGSLSDGDIRSALIKDSNLERKVFLIYNKNFKYINNIEDREQILKLLDQNYKIIPVLSKSKKIINFIDQLNPIKEKKNIIRARSPARISLAGGGTDLTRFFFDQGGSGISLTINKYCNVHLIKRNDKKIIINSEDYKKRIVFKELKSINYNGTLDIIKASIKLLKPDFGFEIFIETDVKPGSGLGGSAAVSSAVIGAINYLQNQKLSKYEISELAFQAERIELGILGGWQDQYSTVFGGCNIMEFKKDTNLVHNLILPNNIFDELERRLIICNTRIPHKGSAIQLRNKTSSKLLNYGNEIKKIVHEIRSDLLRGNIENLGEFLQQTWEIKKKLDKNMTNNKIKKMEKILCSKDLASGCRLLGTGGGGYMLFYVKPLNRFNFINKLNNSKIEYSSIKFDFDGLKVWETNLS